MSGRDRSTNKLNNSMTTYSAIFVVVVVVVIEVIVTPRILSDLKVHRFSDYDNDYDNDRV